MKTFEIKEKLFKSQKFLIVFVLFPFFVVSPKKLSKTLNSEVSFPKNNLKLLASSVGNLKTEVEDASATNSSSLFKRFLQGIGSFFVVVGSGIGKGISETVKFLGQVITFPVTATLYLFSRNAEGATASQNSGGAGG